MNDSDIDIGIPVEMDVKADDNNKSNCTYPVESVPLEIHVGKKSADQDQTEEYQKEYPPSRNDGETKDIEVGGRRTPEDDLNSCCSHKDHIHSNKTEEQASSVRPDYFSNRSFSFDRPLPSTDSQDFTQSLFDEHFASDTESSKMWSVPFSKNKSPNDHNDDIHFDNCERSNGQNMDSFLDTAETSEPDILESFASPGSRNHGKYDAFEEDQREISPSAPHVVDNLLQKRDVAISQPTDMSQQQQQPPPSRDDQLMRHLNSRNDANASDEEKISPALKRRLRDFAFAQQKRRETYGEKNPWGIIGLYDHLTGIRTDIEWAEDAAWRREHDEPYLSWSDFEQAKDTGYNQPFFTYIVMFICTGCLILSIGVNGWKVEPLSVNPMIGPSAQTLIDVGAKKTSLIVQDNEWFRIFSPMVLHAGIIHFILNMVALWFIGYAVEMNHGFLAIAILFIVPATGGTLLSALFLPEYISVGASGGIFGLIGGCIADIVTNWNLLFSKEVNTSNHGQRFRNFKVLVWLLLDIFLNVLIGLTPFVDNFTHLGGMIYGFLCGLSKLERLSKAFFGVQKGFMSKFQNGLVRFIGTILSIVLIVITLILLMKSDGERLTSCRGCRYVSCVPFPFWADYEDKWWYCDDCDLVRADARLNTVTNTYMSMNLTCPDGEVIFIDLSSDVTGGDQNFLQKQLPTYCRDNCNSLFAN